MTVKSPLHQGQLRSMVGFPSTWLEINPSRLDFQPLVRNPTAGWYSTHWMVRIPTILPLHQIYHEQELPVCFDADAGGVRFLAIFGFLNRTDFDVKLHSFLLYEGSDSRMNMEMNLGKYSEEIAKLEGKQVLINGGFVKIKIFGLFDLCALNCLMGKQNHSSTFPCAWTNVSKDHLQNHAGKAHSQSECPNVAFLNMEDYERNLTHHLVAQEGKTSAKSGKEFGSVTGNEANLIPPVDLVNY